jgi:hypothetical protein
MGAINRRWVVGGGLIVVGMTCSSEMDIASMDGSGAEVKGLLGDVLGV